MAKFGRIVLVKIISLKLESTHEGLIILSNTYVSSLLVTMTLSSYRPKIQAATSRDRTRVTCVLSNHANRKTTGYPNIIISFIIHLPGTQTKQAQVHQPSGPCDSSTAGPAHHVAPSTWCVGVCMCMCVGVCGCMGVGVWVCGG